MKEYISDIAFTPVVKEMQIRHGSRKSYAKMEEKGGWKDTISPDLEKFIKERDAFYLATANSEGQPYIQHRGGKKGFLKVIDDHTLGFADFLGNRQYITLGNLVENEKAFIFLMDYANQQRIKIWGKAHFVEDDPELMERLADSDYKGRVERAILFKIEAWDVNCPQHITPRFTQEQIHPTLVQLQNRIRELEDKLSKLGHPS